MSAPGHFQNAAPGFKRFRVARRTRESESIVSFELVPAEGGLPPGFIAGQFIIARIALLSGEVALRNYSLSSDPADSSHWRISIKREPAPATRPDLPAGRVSGYLHEQVTVGDEIDLAGPAGGFTCDESSARPVVLLSGGVGLTPLVSMLHRLSAASSRRLYFIHACENGAVHAFCDEVRALATGRPGIDVHMCYREPRDEDRAAGLYDSEGLVTRETLQALLPLDDYEVYMCGPAAFMQANWRLLRGLGVARERIHYEFFGPATVLEDDSGERQDATPASERLARTTAVSTTGPDAAITVRFHPAAAALPWDPSCHSLLELAEQAGFAPAFNCRIGICNTCVTPLVEGLVEYVEAPLEPPVAGKVLLCCAQPLTAVTLALEPPPWMTR